ncbi:4-hydroxyphenylpyruvate dioxygenase [Streptomyces avidinii]|uniref:4-hydroxymandelate synthase n=1 Tax=Streptomyces avidinii TaxID=1895 RepID=A0ABS4LH81_STRAV|nr:4-hydroxyphenylpyruvate dioxygenase [Streptomyces avidinii]MBP2041486.1 4-hydroxymandelate synthase [Streptomyces avidinii]GGZ34671.1 4-hydroxyphenylpyruvate dioxygenase [Streptomyces avidinii]
MAVQDISYVELFASDKVAAVDYFVSALGFTRVADSVEVDRSSILLQQGDVRLVVTSGRGIWKFLDSHGDGIADIAMTCDDPAAAEAKAVAAGAVPLASPRGNVVVAGFGSVTHTLLPAPARPGGPLADGRRWTPSPEITSTEPSRIRLLDHIAVCLAGGTLEEYADFYRDAFGFSRYSSEYVAVGGQAMDSIVVRSASGRVTFTLVAPDPGKEPGQLDAFLERNGGPGAQHLAFLVDDIIPSVGEARDRGVEFLNTPDTYYDMLAERFEGMAEQIAELRKAQVLADRDEWGHLLQLFTRSPYERNTLFFELIQRQGSRGFGSANIRALYEAVERDRLSS